MTRVNLGSASIERLRRMKAATTRFGFLKDPPKRRRKSCGTCARAQVGEWTVDYESIKRKIVALPKADKLLIRQLLGAKFVAMSVRIGTKLHTEVF